MRVMALAFFAGFHFLPCFGSDEAGWTAWRDLWALVENPGWFVTEPAGTIAVFSFLAFSMLIAAAPFLGPVWRKSRMAWGIATTTSGLATFGFWGAVFSENLEHPGSGGAFLLAATALNFLGLATARIRKPTPPARDNPVDDRQVDCRGEGGNPG